MLTRYNKAISQMNENSGVPELFSEIFKNAFEPV